MNYADSYKKALGERLRFARGWTEAMRNTFRGGVVDPYDDVSHGAFADAYQEHPDHLDQDPLPDLIRQRLPGEGQIESKWMRWAGTSRAIDDAFGEEAPIGEHRGFRYYLSNLGPGSHNTHVLHVAPDKTLEKNSRGFTYAFEMSPDELVKFLPKLDHLSPVKDFAGEEVHPSSFADRSPRQMLENIRDYLTAHAAAQEARYRAAQGDEP